MFFLGGDTIYECLEAEEAPEDEAETNHGELSGGGADPCANVVDGNNIRENPKSDFCQVSVDCISFAIFINFLRMNEKITGTHLI